MQQVQFAYSAVLTAWIQPDGIWKSIKFRTQHSVYNMTESLRLKTHRTQIVLKYKQI